MVHIQKKNYERDKNKKKYLIGKNYELLYLWEFDLKNNYNFCKKQINEFIRINKKN